MWWLLLFLCTLVTGPRSSLSLKLSDTRVDEPRCGGYLRGCRSPALRYTLSASCLRASLLSKPTLSLHAPPCSARRLPHWQTPPALEATQGQNDSFFSQLPYKCYLEELASLKRSLAQIHKLHSFRDSEFRSALFSESIHCIVLSRPFRSGCRVQCSPFTKSFSLACPRARLITRVLREESRRFG